MSRADATSAAIGCMLFIVGFFVVGLCTLVAGIAYHLGGK